MEYRVSNLKIISSPSQKSLRSMYSDNPVLTPKSTLSYYPLSKAFSKNALLKEDSLGIRIKPSNFSERYKLPDPSEISNLFEISLAKSSPYPSLKKLTKTIRTLFKTLMSFSHDSESLLKFLSKVTGSIDNTFDEFEKLKQSIECLTKENTNLKAVLKENSILINQYKQQLQENFNKPNTKEKKKSSTSNMIEQSNRKHLLEKEKLIEKVSILEEYINELKSVTKIETLNTKIEYYRDLYEKTNSEYKTYVKEKSAHIFKLQQSQGLLKEELTKNEQFMKKFQEKKAAYKSKIHSGKRKFEFLQERLLESKEQLLLFKEDISRFFVYKDQYDQLFEQLESMKTKHQQLELNVMAGNVALNSDAAIWISLDDPLFKLVRSTSIVKDLPEINKPAIDKLDYATFGQGKRKKSHIDLKIDPSEVDLKSYKFNRPIFAGFLEINDTSLPLELPFNNWLEITIRGIYDSKFYEHQLCGFETGKVPTRFPEFVYSWLGNFTIDPSNRQVKELDLWKKPAAEKIRMDLLLALAQEKVKRNWEIQTFTEFLNEEMMLDELAFYLHSRNLLFKGPQLSSTPGKFSSVNFLPVTRINEVIDFIMEKVSVFERNELKALLSDKCRNREGVPCLDSGMFLRILLEYYTREKKCRYLGIRTLFNLAPKNGPGQSITFQAFKDIIKNMNAEANEVTISKLFRDSYALSKGFISPDHIFMVCNESQFFFHSLRLKEDPNTTESEIKTMFKSFTESKSSLNLVKDILRNMGIPDLLSNFQRLEQCILSKESGEGVISPLNSFKHLWVIVKQVQTAFQDINSYSLSSFLTQTLKDSAILSGPEFCTSFIEFLESLTLYKLSTKIAVRKIQRNWKERRLTKIKTKGEEDFRKMSQKK